MIDEQIFVWHGQENRYVVLLTWAKSDVIAMNSPVFTICRCCDVIPPYTFTISSRERLAGNCKLSVLSSCCGAVVIPSSNMTLAFPSLHSPCSCNGYSDACSNHCTWWRHFNHNTCTFRSLCVWYVPFSGCNCLAVLHLKRLYTCSELNNSTSPCPADLKWGKYIVSW